MKIQLLSIALTNFKGIQSFRSDFNHATNIYGDNGTGKTSLFDAFTWLLFGKDSTDRKDFEVKTLDAKNQAIPKIDHEVAATLLVDGQTVSLKRTLKEKWQKKRGSAEAEFTGNETLFEWNGVPMQAGEYAAKISGIVDEGLFKLITNSLYFNSMKWQDRRNVLLQMAGNISNEQIITALIAGSNHADFSGLLSILDQGKSVVEYKKEISAKKKLLKDALELVPARIDEASRSLPEACDYSAFEAQRDAFVKHLATIDLNLSDASKALTTYHNALSAKQTQLHGYKSQLSNRQHVIREQFREQRQQREMEIKRLENQELRLTAERDQHNSAIAGNNGRIEAFNLQLAQLRQSWVTEDAKQLVFDESKFECPACKRALEEHDIDAQKEQMRENFNTTKARNLQQITNDAAKAKEQITTLEAANAGLKAKVDSIAGAHLDLVATLNALREEHARISSNEEQELQIALEDDAEANQIFLSIGSLQSELEGASTDTADNTGLLAQKQTITNELAIVNQRLAGKEQRERISRRIEELQNEEKSLAQQLADLEKTEFQIDQFTKAKMDTLESRINGRFQLVKFKLFATQINGGEVECCDTLVNGVPFSDANNASRINAGLDIINTLCQHHGVYAPIFIDNAESVVSLLPTESQVIRLVVSGSHKKLTVENEGATQVVARQAEVFA